MVVNSQNNKNGSELSKQNKKKGKISKSYLIRERTSKWTFSE